MELLKVNELTKTYVKKNKTVYAVDHVSFQVDKGSFIAITGERFGRKHAFAYAGGT